MAPPFEAALSGGERVVTGVALENQKLIGAPISDPQSGLVSGKTYYLRKGDLP